MNTINLNYGNIQKSSENVTKMMDALGRTLKTIRANDARLAPMKGAAFVAFKGRRSYLESEILAQIETLNTMKESLERFRDEMYNYITPINYDLDVYVNTNMIEDFTRIVAKQVEAAFEPVPITESTEMYQIWNSGYDTNGDGVSEGYWEIDQERINSERRNGDKIDELRSILRVTKDTCLDLVMQIQGIYDNHVRPFAEADARHASMYRPVYSPMTSRADYEKSFAAIYGKLWTLDDKGNQIPNWDYLRKCMNTDPAKLSDAQADAIILMYEQLIARLGSGGTDAEADLTKFLQCGYINFRDADGNELSLKRQSDEAGIDVMLPQNVTNIHSELSPVFIAIAKKYRTRTMPWLTEQAIKSIQTNDKNTDAAWKETAYRERQFGVQLLTNMTRYGRKGYGWSYGNGYDPDEEYDAYGRYGESPDDGKKGTIVDIRLDRIEAGEPFDCKLSIGLRPSVFGPKDMQVEMYEFRSPGGIMGNVLNSTTAKFQSLTPNANAELDKTLKTDSYTEMLSKIGGKTGGIAVAGAGLYELGYEWDKNRAAEIETQNRVLAATIGRFYYAAGVYGSISIVDGKMGQPDFIAYDRDIQQWYVEDFLQSDADESDAWKEYRITDDMDEKMRKTNVNAAMDRIDKMINFNFGGSGNVKEYMDDFAKYYEKEIDVR